MTLPQHWPALCMAARLARVPECDQRAYLWRPQGADCAVQIRFYPSLAVLDGGFWGKTILSEQTCIKAGDTRLSDEEAARLWATRPQ